MADETEDNKELLACTSIGDYSSFIEQTSQEMFRHPADPNGFILSETQTLTRTFSGRPCYVNGTATGSQRYNATSSNYHPSSSQPQPIPFPTPNNVAYGPLSTDISKVAPESQSLFTELDDKFDIITEPPKTNIKHPQLVFNNDTKSLHVARGKIFCFYLGQPISDQGGATVDVFLKFADEKNKNRAVLACNKHRDESPYGNMVVRTDDQGVQHCAWADGTQILRFQYPNHDQPSIGLSFACLSSDFTRANFFLHFNLTVGQLVICRRLQVKISTNPGRDSLAASLPNQNIKMRINSCHAAFDPGLKRRRLQSICEGASSNQPSLEPSASDSEDCSNKVYTIEIFGRDSYLQLLQQAHTIAVEQKYYGLKNAGARQKDGLQSSQFDELSSIDLWLDTMNHTKHNHLFEVNRVETMEDLLKVYHKTYFETIGIPSEDAAQLHYSFITWKNVYLYNQFKADDSKKEL